MTDHFTPEQRSQFIANGMDDELPQDRWGDDPDVVPVGAKPVVPTTTKPDYGPLLAIAEIVQLALEHNAVDIARSWSAIAERLMQPIVLMEARHAP